MKLACDVEVSYTLAQANGGIPGKGNKSRASLSIGKKTNSEGKHEELFLIVSTVKNVLGTKYKLKDNVICMFTKFVKDGKVTIRFKEPAHDLSLSKADPVKLKQFLMLMRTPSSSQQNLSISSLPPKMKDLDKPVTRLVVKSRSEYPIKGFPSILETIEAVGINLNKVDKRLLSLTSLRSIDFSNNTISSLPQEMSVISLVELRLAGNRITEFPQQLCAGPLAVSLKCLDLSRNQLTHLPTSLPELKSLVTLKLDCNSLQLLPRGFGKLKQLRFFSASSNKLVVVPHSFTQLSLESVDLFNNPLSASGLLRRCSDLSLPRLQELASRAIRKHKIAYSPQILPVTLCCYLDTAKRCLCGKACFDAYLHYIGSLDLHRISATVTSIDKAGSTRVPVELFLCSARCLKLWKM